jgi:hypothetical protein
VSLCVFVRRFREQDIYNKLQLIYIRGWIMAPSLHARKVTAADPRCNAPSHRIHGQPRPSVVSVSIREMHVASLSHAWHSIWRTDLNRWEYRIMRTGPQLKGLIAAALRRLCLAVPNQVEVLSRLPRAYIVVMCAGSCCGAGFSSWVAMWVKSLVVGQSANRVLMCI